jgi:NAD(P)-dependent dehydrogenase (short-subunit alcohol dehydrogenase family)
MSLTPKTILITGVTKGLGRALTEGFIKAGHVVIGCGRHKNSIEALDKEFKATHQFSVVDLTDDTQVKNWAAHVLKKYSAPDLLINNAAVINRNAPLWELSPAEFDQVIDVNIKGVANVIRHFVPAMLERGKGIIVNFSSGWGRSTAPEVAPYCATKFAIEGLTQALAQELPVGMAAMPVNPGIIDTDMLRSCFGGSAKAYPKPEEWARRAVPFLLKLSPKQNGQSLSITGAVTE